ncbi:hypothetical protein KP509_1Z216400 [Ceratopteris richardii]|nr:hypothetical protein KP509_1Z216400 [Ceratopteris richardii]
MELFMKTGFYEKVTAIEAERGAVKGGFSIVFGGLYTEIGRKCLTTVQGINKSFSYNKILKDLKKEFCFNGNVVDDTELGNVIQLQGDQRKNAAQFLTQAGIATKDQVKIHGF